MKRTKVKDTHLCRFCKKEGRKVRATWKDYTDYACDEHKDKIKIDDGYMSEADYQTWGRY